MDTNPFAIRSRVATLAIACVVIIGLFVAAAASPNLHLTSLQFNPYALISAVTLCINGGLFIYLILKPTRTDERLWLALYLAIAVVYCFAEMMQRLSVTPDAALFWYYVSSPIVAVAPAMLLFALSYTNQSERRYPGVTVSLLMGTLFLIFFYGYTDLVFIRDPKLATLMPWGYDFRKALGPAVSLALVWYDGLLIVALARLISFRRSIQNAILRRQSLFFIFAITIPVVGGTITSLILPVFGITNLLPLATVLDTPAAMLLVYGALRYQLLTINPTLFSSTMLTLMQEAVISTDDRFTILYQNPQAEALLRLPPGNVSGKLSFMELLDPESVAACQHAFANNTEIASVDHLDLRHHKNEVTSVRLHGSRVQVSDQKVWVIVLTDITAELHSRAVIEHEVQVRTAELHQARAYLLSSINSLEQGFILVNARAKIEVVNGMAANLFKLTGNEAAGKALAEVLGHSDWDLDVADAVGKVLNSRQAVRLNGSSRDGSFFQVFITAIVADSQCLGAAIVIEDVTEEKILNRSKDEFFSIASHELRTPLTAIRGNMSIIKQSFPQAMQNHELANMIDDTQNASIRLIELVNDFLDSSKLEQGKMEFNLEPLAMAPVVNQVVGEMRSLAKQRDNTIVLDHIEDLPKVTADKERFQQIIYNLLSNAIKYTEHGTITISGKAAPNDVQLRIHDTGRGISPEGQKLLFHKFQQAGNSLLTRDTAKGTGLGLYIANLLAQNMYGELKLEQSEIEKGSTFLLVLPAAKGHAKHLAAGHAAAITSGHTR